MQRAQLLFMLAWFHAIVQERRTYVPQGWTKAYEFSFADLRSGAMVVDGLLESAAGGGGGGGAGAGAGAGAGGGGGGSGGVPWKFVHGLMENAIYGGRVDNVFDGFVLTAYLRRFFNADMLSNRGTVRLAKGVALPKTNRHRDYLALISSLPEVDEPMVFSLPDNIERSVQRATSRQVLAQLKSLAVLEGAASSVRTWGVV